MPSVLGALLRPTLTTLLDLGLSGASLGFYHPNGFHFDLNTFLSLVLPKNLDLRTSAFEFWILVLMRGFFKAIGSLLVYRRKGTGFYEHTLNIFSTTCISYSLIKVLCFCELENQLYYPGVWLNVAINALFSINLLILWSRHIQPRFSEIATTAYSRMEPDVETRTEAQVQEGETKRTSVLHHVQGLLAYCKLHWVWFTVGFGFLLVYSAARVFIPYYIGQVVADIMAESQGKKSDFSHNILMMIGLTLVSTVFGGLRGGTFTQATALINRAMRRDLFGSLVKQEMAFFDKLQTGAILSRLTTDCQTVSSSVSTNVNVFLRNSVMLVGSLVFMVHLSWKLTLITFIAVPPLTLFSKYYGAYYDKLSEQTQNTMAEANLTAEEVLGSMRTVRAFACEDRETGRYLEKLNHTLAYNKKKAIAYMGYVWVNEFSENVVLIAVLIYAARLAVKGELAAGAATSFFFYQMQLSENFTGINYVFSGLMESVGASRKVLEYIRREPQIKYDGSRRTEVEGRIDIENVAFAYPSRPNTNVLNDLSIHIAPGETAALVGPSGAGKSSIIALLEHFYTTQQGHIRLDGVDISDFAHHFYHQQVALVAQEPVLYSGSVRDNILYGVEAECTEEDMVEAAKLANAHQFIMEMEHGYDTKCGEKGVQMSGGQKQRIAIARALVRRPAVLILDEATSALDAESEYVIQRALQQCAVGRTVIVIAHRLSTVERADRIFVVQAGRVVQAGAHQTLMAEDGLYRSLVQRQLLGADSEHATPPA